MKWRKKEEERLWKAKNKNATSNIKHILAWSNNKKKRRRIMMKNKRDFRFGQEFCFVASLLFILTRLFRCCCCFFSGDVKSRDITRFFTVHRFGIFGRVFHVICWNFLCGFSLAFAFCVCWLVIWVHVANERKSDGCCSFFSFGV